MSIGIIQSQIIILRFYSDSQILLELNSEARLSVSATFLKVGVSAASNAIKFTLNQEKRRVCRPLQKLVMRQPFHLSNYARRSAEIAFRSFRRGTGKTTHMVCDSSEFAVVYCSVQ